MSGPTDGEESEPVAPRPEPHVLAVVALGGLHVVEVVERFAATADTRLDIVDVARVWAASGGDRDALVGSSGARPELRLLVVGAANASEPLAAALGCADRVVVLATPEDWPVDGSASQALGTTPDEPPLCVLVAPRSARPREHTHLEDAEIDAGVRAVDLADAGELRYFLRYLLDAHQSAARLRNFSLFDKVDDDALGRIGELVEWGTVHGGEVLIRQGDLPGQVYLVDSGRFEVVVDAGTDRERSVGEVAGGAVLGETGALTNRPRTATVRARRDGLVGVMSGPRFRRLLSDEPRVGANLAIQLAGRAASASGLVGRSIPPHNVTVLPLDKVDGDRLRWLHESVLQWSGRSGLTSSVLTRDVVEREAGAGLADVQRDDPGESELLRWLHRLEQQTDVVVQVCEPNLEAWTRRCLRQADAVVLLADGTSAPRLRELEESGLLKVRAGGPSFHLVLVQPPGVAEAQGTQAWLDARPGYLHHHVRHRDDADLARAMRRILHRACGLALSGASARASAHFGVVRGVRAAGVPIDVIAGSSSGAGTAAMVALGVSPEELFEPAFECMRGVASGMWRVQPPLTSFNSGRGVERATRAAFGERRLEDQFIQAILTAVDISHHRLVRIRTGPMWLAMRASTSLPVIWPPVAVDDQVLVDGGILSYMPLDALLPACAHGLALGSDLDTAPNDGRGVFDGYQAYGATLSGWGQLGRKIVPGLKPTRAPSLTQVLFETMLIASVKQRREMEPLMDHPSVHVIAPELHEIGLMNMDRETALRFDELGYAAAREVADPLADQVLEVRR